MGHDEDQCGRTHLETTDADVPAAGRDDEWSTVAQHIAGTDPSHSPGRAGLGTGAGGRRPAGSARWRLPAAPTATRRGGRGAWPSGGDGAIPTTGPVPWLPAAASARDGTFPWRLPGVKARGAGDDDGGLGLSRRELLVVAAATSGAGATVGDAASNVVGDGTTDLDQAVIIRDVETYASGGGLSVVDSSNTDFVVGVDVTQGERYVLHLLVDNRADEKANQRFRFDEIPESLSVEVFGDPPTGVDVQAAAHTEWAVNIEPEHPTDLPSPTSVPDDEQIIEVLVEVANTAAPKTYELNGTLEPTSL